MDEVQGPGLTALITRLSKTVYRRSTDELLGMKTRHYVTLSFLRDHEGMTQNQLGETLCMDANNLVLLLNELEAGGLAERRRDPTDRRRHIVELTVAGRGALSRAEHAQNTIEDDVFSALDAHERAQLRSLIVKALNGQPEIPLPPADKPVAQTAR